MKYVRSNSARARLCRAGYAVLRLVVIAGVEQAVSPAATARGNADLGPALMEALDQIPALQALHTRVQSLSEFESDHGRWTVRARLTDGASVVATYDAERTPYGLLITDVTLKDY